MGEASRVEARFHPTETPRHGKGLLRLSRGNVSWVSPCPICSRPAAPRRGATSDNLSHPFCSARCQSVDLSRWLDESYRVPVEADEDTLAMELAAAAQGQEVES